MYLGMGVFFESRAPHHPAGDLLFPPPSATKQLYPEDPDPSLFGYPRVLGKSCPGFPQIPSVPYNRSVSVSSTPASSQPEVHPSPGVQGPPKLSSRAFVPTARKRSTETLRPRSPLTASSFLRAAALHEPRRPLAWPQPRPPPQPALPPSLPPRGSGSRPRRSSSRSGRATPDSRCAVSAPLRGPARHCLLSAPNPRPRNRRRPTPRRGRQRPEKRPGRAEPALPASLSPPPPPPHLARRRCRVPAAREGRCAPSAHRLCAVPLGPRWWAPRGWVQCPRPLPSHRGWHRGTWRNEVGDPPSSRAVCSWGFTAAGGVWLCTPLSGSSKPRLQPRSRDFCGRLFFFFFF